jgi:hypothetical protein
MTLKLICSVLIAFISVFGGISFADQLASPRKDPLLTPSEAFWFFGLIPPDSWVTHHYLLTNNQADTVTILRIIPVC